MNRYGTSTFYHWMHRVRGFPFRSLGFPPVESAFLHALNISRMNSAANCAFRSANSMPDGLAVLHRQLVAQFVTEVTVISNAAHGRNEITIILVRLASDDAIMTLVTANAAIGAALEFAADMRHDLARGRQRAPPRALPLRFCPASKAHQDTP